jgi:hypothetical protein
MYRAQIKQYAYWNTRNGLAGVGIIIIVMLGIGSLMALCIPREWQWIITLSLLPMMFVILFGLAYREQRRIKQQKAIHTLLTCPGCQGDLTVRADIVIATHCCHNCGRRLFTMDEPSPIQSIYANGELHD